MRSVANVGAEKGQSFDGVDPVRTSTGTLMHIPSLNGNSLSVTPRLQLHDSFKHLYEMDVQELSIANIFLHYLAVPRRCILSFAATLPRFGRYGTVTLMYR